MDPTNLNKAITREHYHSRTPEDIAHILADACIMTMCDCKKGYWHQKLDPVSSFLTTFNTEIGRFRYTVMPLGITVAGDVFQCKLDQCFGRIKQVMVIADDIMIVGKQQNHRGHNIASTTLLETTQKCNIKLNFDKLQYKKIEVDFFGETCTTDGHKPTQSKVSAMPAPMCKKQAQSFIGMVNYLSKFSVRLSDPAEPLANCSKKKYPSTGDLNTKSILPDEKGDCQSTHTHIVRPCRAISELFKDKVPFNWGREHQKAFYQMKREIVRALILIYYNPRKETVLQTDASTKGLGACLLQEESLYILQVKH